MQVGAHAKKKGMVADWKLRVGENKATFGPCFFTKQNLIHGNE